MDCIGHSIDLFNGNKMSRSYKIIGIYESMAVNSAITNSEVYPETIFIPIQSASFITGSDNIDILQFWMKKDVKGLRKISKDVVEYLELKTWNKKCLYLHEFVGFPTAIYEYN